MNDQFRIWGRTSRELVAEWSPMFDEDVLRQEVDHGERTDMRLPGNDGPDRYFVQLDGGHDGSVAWALYLSNDGWFCMDTRRRKD